LHCFRLSALGPVLKPEAINAGEIAGIVRNENHIDLQRATKSMTYGFVVGTGWTTDEARKGALKTR